MLESPFMGNRDGYRQAFLLESPYKEVREAVTVETPTTEVLRRLDLPTQEIIRNFAPERFRRMGPHRVELLMGLSVILRRLADVGLLEHHKVPHTFQTRSGLKTGRLSYWTNRFPH